VSAVGRLATLDLGRGAAAPAPAKPAAARDVYFRETGLARCEVLAREALEPGRRYRGPLVVESMDTTVVVPPGWRLQADARGFLALEVEAHA